jgi:pimeloyl-ACP methyl ester carboxylesterase
LKLDNVVLIAHSMGGYPAFEFAYNYPERVKALVLAEGAVSIKGFNNQPGSKEVGNMFGKVFQIGKKDGIDKGKEALLGIGVSQSAVNNPLSTNKFKQMVMDYSGWHWQNEDPQKNYKQINFEDLSNLHIPVLLINGELSPDHYHQTMQKMHNYLPNSKHVILKNSGHMLNLENPEQFNDELLEFLKENNLN